MRARFENETAVDIMRHNIMKMNDKELVQCGFFYMKRQDEEGKIILKLIEVEQDRRGIY